jgi:hypothetical protein
MGLPLCYVFCLGTEFISKIAQGVWIKKYTKTLFRQSNTTFLRANITYHLPAQLLKKGISSILLFILCSIDMVSAQSPPQSEYKLQAIFLYNFTRFIDWPGSAFASRSEPFKIGIVGNDPFGSYLDEAVRGERVSGRPIVIERYKNARDVKDCHMLYISSKDQKEIKKIINTLADKNTLTISEDPEFVKWGGMIRMYSDDNKIRLQINDAAARKVNLKISAKLLNVADVYYP